MPHQNSSIQELCKKRDIDGLIALLKHPEAAARREAACALGELGDPSPLEPLLSVETSSDNVDWNSVPTPEEIGIDRAVEPLIAALRDKGKGVREAAAEALGKIGDARAVEPLIAALKDGHEYVREAAAESLGQIGDARAVEPLIAALRDELWHVRQAAARALGQIGDARAVEPLIAALRGELWLVRKAAARALGKIGDARAVEPLIAALRDEWGSVREAAAGALDKLGWKPDTGENTVWYWLVKREPSKCVALGALAVEPLIAALRDEEWHVRQAAAQALGKIGGDRAVDALLAVLRGNYVHGLLLQKLEKMHSEEARQAAAFLKTWDEKSAPVHLLIRQALAEFAHPFVVHLLATTLAEEDAVCCSAAEALWRLGCAQELARLLKEAPAQTRREIIVGLGSTRDPETVPLMVIALEDEDKDVRDAAACNLMSLRHPAAVEALMVVLEKDEESAVRWRAAIALGRIGDRRAVEALIAAALRDPNSDVRGAAATALGKIGDERAIHHLVAMLSDVSSSVRQSVACALDDLGWQAEPGAQTAWYWAAKQDWQRCAALGKSAIEPLLFALQDLQTAKEAASALEAIGWQPAHDENAVWYWAAKDDWEQCIALGGTAVQPLLALLLKEESLQRRRSIASALVKLYRELPLSERAPILAVKENIIHIHQDVGGTKVEGSPWGCQVPHTDLDLGVEFPL